MARYSHSIVVYRGQRRILISITLHDKKFCFGLLLLCKYLLVNDISRHRLGDLDFRCFHKAFFTDFTLLALSRLEFQDVNISKDVICRHGNLIWNTIMPDGLIAESPYIQHLQQILI